MTPLRLTINARAVSEMVEARTHLADVLRDKLALTGTHLRCEQGVCGACTLLIDGQPARSCITLAVSCQGADVTTIEGLEHDPVIAALRRAFSEEHGLQCGFCTPGMLVTARDIVIRVPDADEARVRLELSGNLCRCTGYVGIVRAVCRALKERREGAFVISAAELRGLGPVGSRPATGEAVRPQIQSKESSSAPASETSEADLGLGGKKPTIEMRQSFIVARPPEEVWRFFDDLNRVVPCLPGATLTQQPAGDHVHGQFAAKIGPITAKFGGEARVVRDEVQRRGVILGAGRDRLSGSRTRAEIEYKLTPSDGGHATRVDFTVRVLIAGPLAQFSRSGIVEDLAARLTQAFAANLDRRLNQADGDDADVAPAPLMAGSLLRAVLVGRIKKIFGRLWGH